MASGTIAEGQQPCKGARVSADQAAVFKPVNTDVESKMGRDRKVMVAPESPPQQGTTHGDLSCDTPKPNKAPSENEVGTKRSFVEFMENESGATGEKRCPCALPRNPSLQHGAFPSACLPPHRTGLIPHPSRLLICRVAIADDEPTLAAAGEVAEEASGRPSRQCKKINLVPHPESSNASDVDDDDEMSERATPKQDKNVKPVALDTRQKGPCSYEHCPNPNHSSGGGFKVVTGETKAGARDWSVYSGRVFCNACFTQYATRGTLQRPGRLLAAVPPLSAQGHVAHSSHHHHHLEASVSSEGTCARPAVSHHNVLYVTPPAPSRIPTYVKLDEDLENPLEACVELSLVASGRHNAYQWMRDGRPIQGATSSTLLIDNPRTTSGEITCRVTNEWGSTTPFVPVTFPLTALEAKERFATPMGIEDKLPAHYKLTCTCGVSRTGTPEELLAECACGLQVCGTVVPV